MCKLDIFNKLYNIRIAQALANALNALRAALGTTPTGRAVSAFNTNNTIQTMNNYFSIHSFFYLNGSMNKSINQFVNRFVDIFDLITQMF